MKSSEHNTAWEVIFSSLVITLRSLHAVIICLLDWFASFIFYQMKIMNMILYKFEESFISGAESSEDNQITP